MTPKLPNILVPIVTDSGPVLINPWLIELAQYVQRCGPGYGYTLERHATHLRLTMASGEQHIVGIEEYAAAIKEWCGEWGVSAR